MQEITVRSAEYIDRHILEIEFSDGYKAPVDFAPFIFSAGDTYKKYKTVEGFKAFQVIDGNINWDDYTMIFTNFRVKHRPIGR